MIVDVSRAKRLETSVARQSVPRAMPSSSRSIEGASEERVRPNACDHDAQSDNFNSMRRPSPGAQRLLRIFGRQRLPCLRLHSSTSSLAGFTQTSENANQASVHRSRRRSGSQFGRLESKAQNRGRGEKNLISVSNQSIWASYEIPLSRRFVRKIKTAGLNQGNDRIGSHPRSDARLHEHRLSV